MNANIATCASLSNGRLCFCDEGCHTFGLCCPDIHEIGCYREILLSLLLYVLYSHMTHTSSTQNDKCIIFPSQLHVPVLVCPLGVVTGACLLLAILVPATVMEHVLSMVTAAVMFPSIHYHVVWRKKNDSFNY